MKRQRLNFIKNSSGKLSLTPLDEAASLVEAFPTETQSKLFIRRI